MSNISDRNLPHNESCLELLFKIQEHVDTILDEDRKVFACLKDSLKNVTCSEAEVKELENFKSMFQESVKSMTDSKELIQNQLGYPKQEESCGDSSGNTEHVRNFFRRKQWKFDNIEFEKIQTTFPLASKENVLNLASISQWIWDVYCLLCDGKT